MNNAEIRKIYSEKKEALSKIEVEHLSQKIFAHFCSQFDLQMHQKVHCFLSIPEKGEVDTQLFLDYFFKNNIRVFVPKIVAGKLIALEITENTILMKNSWGIREPEGNTDCGIKDYDLIITPLLYADRFGNRVGYGKGFYDRFFSKINEDVVKVGVSFFEPEVPVDDVSDVDVRLNYLVTSTEVLSFDGLTSRSTK